METAKNCLLFCVWPLA